MLSRFLAPGLALLLLCAFALLYGANYAAYLHLLNAYGAAPYRFPFVDIYTNLAALDCARKGVDVYIANPCDVFGNPFIYSPLLLLGTHLPIGRAATPAVGLCVDLLFLASLTLLPPPKRFSEQALRIAITLSSATVYGLERANLDLFLFALILAAACLLARPGMTRLAGYPLLVLATLVKFYPAATLLVLAKERRRVFLAVAASCCGALGVFIALNHRDILRALGGVPGGVYFAEGFGAVNLPGGLAQLALPSTLSAWRPELCGVLWLALVFWLAIQARRWAIDASLLERFASLGEAERMRLVVGALAIVGCFLAAQNIYYRAVFVLMVAPGLLALTRRPGDRDAVDRSLSRRLTAMLLILTWGEAVRRPLASGAVGSSHEAVLLRAADVSFWLLREVAWWQFVAMLTAVLWWFASQSPLVSAARTSAGQAAWFEGSWRPFRQSSS
jgi:hypothetical protein